MKSLGKTISYTSGSVAANLVSLAFGTYVQYYYVAVLKGDTKWIGIAATIHAVYATLVYPFLGYLSDRTKSRWGRRVPFIVLGAIPLGLAYMIVWTPPIPATDKVLFSAYFLFTAILFDTLFNLTMVNWSALFPELFQTQRERAYASAWKQMIGIVGLIVGLGLTPMLASNFGWGVTGVLFGVIAAVSLLTTIPSLQLKQRKAAVESAATFENQIALPVLQALKYTFVNKSFVSFVLMRFFVQFAFTMLTANLSYYVRFNLALSPDDQTYILLATLLVALPLVYVWGYIVTKVGAFNTTLAAILLFILALVPFFLTKTFLTTLLCGVGLGIGLSGILMLTDVLISDVIDADELATGVRREGMFYGIHGLIVSLCTPAQAVVTTVVLVTSGFVKTGAQPDSALAGMRSMVTLIPMSALVIGVLIFLFYPLRRRVAAFNRRQLDDRRQANA